jgi:hypothetical protein
MKSSTTMIHKQAEGQPKKSRDTVLLDSLILLAQIPPLPLRRAPAKIWAAWLFS